MDSKQSSVAAATPNTSNDYKYTYVSEELKLEPRPEAVNSTEPLVYLLIRMILKRMNLIKSMPCLGVKFLLATCQTL